MKQFLRLGIFFVLGFLNVYAQSINFPALSGRVVDEANILTTAQKRQITDQLKAHEEKTGDQVVVVTLKSLQGNEIEEYGYQLGRYWKIGQKEKNNGVLLIVAPNERKVRIEVGYGLEGKLTDALSKVIIENDIIPSFKKGNMQEGILKGTQSILRVLQNDYVVPKQEHKKKRKVNNDSIASVIIVLFFIAFILNIFLHEVIVAAINAVIMAVYIWEPSMSLIMGILTFFFTWAFLSTKGDGGPSDFSSGGSFGSSSFGGGGGFSGGGGSFGGGGASGSW